MAQRQVSPAADADKSRVAQVDSVVLPVFTLSLSLSLTHSASREERRADIDNDGGGQAIGKSNNRQKDRSTVRY